MIKKILRRLAKWFRHGCKAASDVIDYVGTSADMAVPGIKRVKCRNEQDSIGKPREHSIYGLVDKDGVRCAVVHWQGWEDAGWKVIPVDEFEDFYSIDLDPSSTEFYVLKPKTVHEYSGGEGYPKIIVDEFKWSQGRLLAGTPYGDWIDTEYLYDVKDPQWY